MNPRFSARVWGIRKFSQSPNKDFSIPREKTGRQAEVRGENASIERRRPQEREGGTTNAPPTSLETVSNLTSPQIFIQKLTEQVESLLTDLYLSKYRDGIYGFYINEESNYTGIDSDIDFKWE